MSDTPTYAMLADMRDRALIAERELTATRAEIADKEGQYIETMEAALSKINELDDQLSKVTEQQDGLRKRIAQLEDELANACKKVEELAEIGLDQMDKERATSRKLSDYRSQRDRLAEALQKLADCDWVITLPDRMDAVRTIAIEALQFLTPTQTEPK